MDGVKRSVSMERLEQILPAAYDNYQRLVPALEHMIHLRVETLSQLNGVADELDKRHRQGNIAKLVGSGVGVIGSATALAALAMTPFTAGTSLLIAGGAAGVATSFAGVATAAGAHITEKAFEKVDLEKIQQAIDRDRRQCEEVSKLWKEFDSYCVDVINTIALADPKEESDIASLQMWVQVALDQASHSVTLIAEAFQCQLSCSGPLCDCTGEQLLCGLGTMALTFFENSCSVKFKSIVSKIWNVYTGIGTIAFLVIAGMGVGNLLVFLLTAIDIHKGSLSKVAQDLREKSRLLQQELDKWLGEFGTK